MYGEILLCFYGWYIIKYSRLQMLYLADMSLNDYPVSEKKKMS
jgi:hypothetical protein